MIKQISSIYKAIFGSDAPWVKLAPPSDPLIYEGKTIQYSSIDSHAPLLPDIGPFVRKTQGLLALDVDWQFPAITEEHALRCLMNDSRRLPDDVLYIGYPWATLIDKIGYNAHDLDLHMNRFDQFCKLLPKKANSVTVCQHIDGKLHVNLFRQAGISDVFWSHATHTDVAHSTQELGDVRFHPFPLYPVQFTADMTAGSSDEESQRREHLFSFIGARAQQYYLKETRNWIIDLLADEKRGLIIGRDDWHYMKVVFDFQIRGIVADKQRDSLVDLSASDQFRESLLNSIFSLCPAGSGPNSIRLWESIGAGSIPVILADTWAPPGDRKLWDIAAVFCEESPEAVKALPDRLAMIAADPLRLAQMRHAMRQLWLLYGPQSFVTDVMHLILAKTECSRTTHAGEADLYQSLKKELKVVANTPLAEHFLSALSHARKISENDKRSAPAVLRGAPPKIAFFGRHSILTPLSHKPIQRLIGERLELVDDIKCADLLVAGYNLDWRKNIETLKPLLERRNALKLAVISEEPLWDITWSGPFFVRNRKMVIQDFEVNYTFLNHQTSNIYHFDQLPYFILTSDHYPTRYAQLMSRFMGMSPTDLHRRWLKAPITAAFFAENRKGEIYSRMFPRLDVAGLCDYRSTVADLVQGSGVMRVGKGWGTEVNRRDLTDWHLDKLAQLDGRVRMVSSYENVHQRNYISEKIFDSFAVGGLPVYWAGPKHRIFEFVPETSMLNTIYLDPSAAAERITAFIPDVTIAQSWLETCAKLAKLLGNFQTIARERQRVADAVVAEIMTIV